MELLTAGADYHLVSVALVGSHLWHGHLNVPSTIGTAINENIVSPFVGFCLNIEKAPAIASTTRSLTTKSAELGAVHLAV